MKRKMNIDDLANEMRLVFSPASSDEIREMGVDTKEGVVAGWASTPSIDSYGTSFVTGAFSKAIARRGLRGGQAVKFLIGHDTEKPAGVITKLEYRGERLWIEAELELQITYVRDMWLAAKIAGGFSFSIRFANPSYEYVDDQDGKEYIRINEADLLEVSIVTIPANDDCIMTEIRSNNSEGVSTLEQFERKLVSDGLVSSRNGARKITELAKRSPELFKILNASDRVSDDEENKRRVGLPAEEVRAVSGALEKLRAAIKS